MTTKRDARPICAICTRNARTADTPRVIVRVETSRVVRDANGLKVLFHCHGTHGVLMLREDDTEDTIEAIHVFAPEPVR